jgi:glycosyltransferase involved in cell wall biosynthesis
MTRAIRLTVLMTHPVQYYSPWFRYISQQVPDLKLKVLYASEPLPHQQGTGFDSVFEWDVPVREGHDNELLRPSAEGHRFDNRSFWGVDVPDVFDSIEATAPDVVLLNGWHSVVLMRAIFACHRRRIPLLYRGDTNLVGRNRSARTSLWRLRTGWLLRRFDRFLAVGQRVREYLASFGLPSQSTFDSPHAVDNEFFSKQAAPLQEQHARSRARMEWGISAESFVVLFVGKLVSEKRPQDVFHAVSRLGRGVSLLVVGSGSLETGCRALGADLGIDVLFRGFSNQTELGRAYGLSDCLVLPSLDETWGLVVNEAMATGLPCVVSDRVGCAPDLVEAGRTGEIFAAGDVPALVSAVARIRGESANGASRSSACRRKMEAYDFAAASRGLVAACRSVVG